MNLKKLIIAIAFVLCSVGLIGCAGQSAYDIAVQNGFVGSETEWLASLEGKSVSIQDVYEHYLTENPDISFDDFLLKYLSDEFDYEEYIINNALRSAVSVLCYFVSKTNQEFYSAGSGIIYEINEDITYIVTNYHVIYESDSNTATGVSADIGIYLYGSEYSNNKIAAEFVGGSIDNDIAILSIDSNDLNEDSTAVTITDSSDIYVGEMAIAIGNPEGNGISVTSGIISVDSEHINIKALNNPNATTELRVIRVDTPINSGNSGGGLFNKAGHLIGIVNAKDSGTSIEGIAYALPSVKIDDIVQNILKSGGYKANLGITVAVSASKAIYNTDIAKYAIIESVAVSAISNPSISYGKFHVGDVIVSVALNDEEIDVTRTFHFMDFIYKIRSGDTVTFNVLRESATVVINISLSSSDFIKIT